MFNVLVLSGFSSPADTIVPHRPPRPPKNCELSPHVRLNRGRQLTLTNLLIFIRFADEEEFSELFETVNLMFNDTTVPHAYWVFRPNSSTDITNGNVNDAAFGYDNRTAFGPTTNPHPYLTTGTPETSFEITNIQYSGDYASFDVRFLTDGVRDYWEGHIAVYPNPVNTELNILAEDVSRVEIYDLLGKMVLSDDCPDSRIDVSSLMQGMYVVKVFTRNGCFTEKFMKK